MLVLLLIIAIVWMIGSVYTAQTEVEVDPRASGYTLPLKGQFDMETFDEIMDRSKDLLVAPEVLRDAANQAETE